MKSAPAGLVSRTDTAEERLCELQDMTVESSRDKRRINIFIKEGYFPKFRSGIQTQFHEAQGAPSKTEAKNPLTWHTLPKLQKNHR